MFGYLRFLLALFVLMSHMGVRFFSLNPGVFAVVIFYILAGYVTTYLFFEVMPKKNRIAQFYIDRVIRIFPLYTMVLILTLIFIISTNYGHPEFTFLKMLNNIFIIPLNYYMYIDVNILTNPKWNLIPPAWSLGAELQAYVLLPFLLLRRKLFFIFFAGSFLVYTLANFSLLQPDYFGYRLIAGVLFFFLIGSLIKGKRLKSLVFIYMAVFFEFYLLLVTHSINKYSYTKETMLGLLIGIPVIWLLANRKNIVLNRLLGRLSYSIFLVHFPSIWLYRYMHIFSKENHLFLSALIVSSVLLSMVLVKLESIIIYKLKEKIKRQ